MKNFIFWAFAFLLSLAFVSSFSLSDSDSLGETSLSKCSILTDFEEEFSEKETNQFCTSGVGISLGEEMSCGTGIFLEPILEAPDGGFDISVEISTFSQRLNETWGNNSCAPTSAFIALDRLDSPQCDVIMDSPMEVVDMLRGFMKTNDRGTLVDNFHLGIAKYLGSKNFTGYTNNTNVSDVRMNVYGRGAGFPPKQNGFQYQKFNNKLTRKQLEDRLAAGDSVFFSISQTLTTGHVMVLSGMETTPGPNGRYKVQFSDPWRQQLITLEMDSSGRVYDNKGRVFSQQSVITLSKG